MSIETVSTLRPKKCWRMSASVSLVAFLFAISVTVAVSVGSVPIPAGTVCGVILEKFAPGLVEVTWSKGTAAIVWDIRLPRALLATMVGGGLAAVGASLQAVTRNPLADPHLLGISSGGPLARSWHCCIPGCF